ncbi:MAG: NADH:flavin oxidoreductase, partial [Planctomycetota bacterium]|jgi:hypothetical protein
VDAVALEGAGVEAVEVSCGTMDAPFEIFRGGAPVEIALRHNILFRDRPRWQKWLWKKLVMPGMKKRVPPFREAYNLEWARAVRRVSKIPVILVGGMRSLETVERVLEAGDADAAAFCRPLVCEPDLAARLRRGEASGSACANCNTCALMCDSDRSLRCYRGGAV